MRERPRRHLLLFSSFIVIRLLFSFFPPLAVAVCVSESLVVEMLSRRSTSQPRATKFGGDGGGCPTSNTSNLNPNPNPDRADRAERVWWLLAQAQDFPHHPAAAGTGNKIITTAAAAADHHSKTKQLQSPQHLQEK